MKVSLKIALALQKRNINVSPNLLHKIAGSKYLCWTCHRRLHFAERIPKREKVISPKKAKRFVDKYWNYRKENKICGHCNIKCNNISKGVLGGLYQCPRCGKMFDFS